MIFASKQIKSPDSVITRGLTSTRDKSFSKNSLIKPLKISLNCEHWVSLSPRFLERSLACDSLGPLMGSISALNIFSGVSSATSSIFTPPSVEAITTSL